MEDVYEAIRLRAYELYLERLSQGAEGDDLTDWLVAEQQVAERHRQ
jgi:hypothetical protein